MFVLTKIAKCICVKLFYAKLSIVFTRQFCPNILGKLEDNDHNISNALKWDGRHFAK